MESLECASAGVRLVEMAWVQDSHSNPSDSPAMKIYDKQGPLTKTDVGLLPRQYRTRNR